jgi:two-component system chemotaxis response regulator CheY
MSLRILIVDDSASIRNLVRTFIESNTEWQVCGEAENGRVAVEKVFELKPQAVILDLSMPVMNGLDAAREIARIDSKVQMVLFTMHVSDELRRYAETVGIKDVISKSEKIGERLIGTLRALCAREFPAT